MEKTLSFSTKGWKPEETRRLMEQACAAAAQGRSLKQVFEQVGQELGRKPNSIRNYYYLQVRNGSGETQRRTASFALFTEEEVHQLLREILCSQARGRSVRSCVKTLSQGDQSRMIRYQNKYRSLLQRHPERVQAVYEELRQEGALGEPLPAFDHEGRGTESPEQGKSLPLANVSVSARKDTFGQRNADALTELDRLKVRYDLLCLEEEDLQNASRELVALCKEFLGIDKTVRWREQEDFCRKLAECLPTVEKYLG